VQVTLSAEVSGEIVFSRERLRDGSPVLEGQTLLRIDEREYQQGLVRAQSMVADLEAQLDRLSVEKTAIKRLAAIAERELAVNRDEQTRLAALFERSEASKREYDMSRLAFQRSLREWQELLNRVELISPRRASMAAALDAQKASSRLAALSLERCSIVAPFDGVVEEIFVEVGDRVQVADRMMRIVAPDRIEIPIELQVSARPHVTIGARCLLFVDSMPDVQWEGVVSRISPVANSRSRTFSLYVEVDNAEYDTPLIPGFFVSARIEGPVLRDAIAVPRGSIVDNAVFVASEDFARRRTVSVEQLIGELAVLSGEVDPGDDLILTNLDVLYDGAPVRTITRPKSDEAHPAIVWQSTSNGDGNLR
jgi:multidrug resistance efflux pump